MAEAVGNDPTQVLPCPWISNPEPYPISHASVDGFCGESRTRMLYSGRF